MTRTSLVAVLGLLLAGAAHAQTPGPVTTLPPGCLTPHPGSPGSPLPAPLIIPWTPGTPSTPGTTPGTPDTSSPTPTQPSDGGATPGDAGAAAGAAATGAAVAGGGGEGGSGGLSSGSPNMIGDLGTRGVATMRQSVSYGAAVRPGSTLLQALVAGGAFKIAENESPRPQDRFFLTYNYFNGVSTGGPSGNRFDLHRQVVGFEATFFDGDASFGMRLPFLQRTQGEGNNTVDGIGDLSLILKYAFLNDRRTGDVVSTGVVVTAPTGRDIILGNGEDIHNWLFQPWTGFILNGGRVFAQGFVSAIIPIEGEDAAVISTDLAVGYRLYQSRAILSSIIPTLEAHFTTPLSKRGLDRVLSGREQVGIPDQLVVTAGVHFGLGSPIGSYTWDRAWLTIAAAAPVTGPRLFDFEGVVQLNFLY